MEKKLNAIYPIITSSPSIATLVTILQSNPATQPWLYNHFTQLIYIKDEFDNRGIFIEDQPSDRNTIFSEIISLEYSKMNKQILSNLKISPIMILENLVDNNYYIKTSLDNFYISHNYSSFGKIHFFHPAFIYGYDSLKKIVYIGDFFNGNKFNFYTISYLEFTNSFFYTGSTDVECFEYLENIEIIKVRDNRKEEIDLNQMILQYSDYYNSEDNTSKYKGSHRRKYSSIVYGLSCYNQFISDISHDTADIRTAHVFYDHALINKHKISYLYDNDIIKKPQYLYLTSIADSTLNMSIITRNMFLKYILLKAKCSVEKIPILRENLITRYKLLESMDKELCEQILCCLTKSNN